MDPSDTISIYLNLMKEINLNWGAFAVIASVVIGWLLSSKACLSLSQRITLTFGYFAVTLYIISKILSRYRLLNALIEDVSSLQNESSEWKLSIISEITEYKWAYGHYDAIVWTSYGLISVLFLWLIWSGITERKGKEV